MPTNSVEGFHRHVKPKHVILPFLFCLLLYLHLCHSNFSTLWIGIENGNHFSLVRNQIEVELNLWKAQKNIKHPSVKILKNSSTFRLSRENFKNNNISEFYETIQPKLIHFIVWKILEDSLKKSNSFRSQKWVSISWPFSQKGKKMALPLWDLNSTFSSLDTSQL